MSGKPPERRPAPHVVAALAAAQAKVAPRTSPAGAPRAAHVQAALGATAQAQPAPPGTRPLAAHVQKAIGTRPVPGPAAGPAMPVQPKLASPPPRPPAPVPPRPAIIQRAQQAFDFANLQDGDFANKNFPWKQYNEWQQSQKPVIPVVDQIQIGGSNQHLEDFAKGTDKIKEDDPANYVLAVAAVNSQVVQPVAKKDPLVEGFLTSPDQSNAVRDTVDDGEVKPLIGIFNAFKAVLAKPSNQKKNLDFTVALSGSYGACDGCKKRIARFAQEWAREAAAVMINGTQARLKITYRYLVPAKGFKRKWGTNVYGWQEDGEDSPLFHTIEAIVRGDKEDS